MRIWLLNGKNYHLNLFKSWEFGKIEWWNGNFYIGNYRISFISYFKSKILKLPMPSNERGFNGKITVPWQPLLLPLINGSTVYYRFRTIKQVAVTQSAHTWWHLVYSNKSSTLSKAKFSTTIKNMTLRDTMFSITIKIWHSS